MLRRMMLSLAHLLEVKTRLSIMFSPCLTNAFSQPVPTLKESAGNRGLKWVLTHLCEATPLLLNLMPNALPSYIGNHN